MLNQVPDWLRGDGLTVLAGAVRAARKRQGLTLAELATAIGLDKGYLSKVERGLKAPSVATVLNLAKVLRVPVAQLFGEAIDESAIHVSRADAASARIDEPGYRLRALTVGSHGAGIEGFLVYPQPDFSEEFRAEHEGEELLFVVQGRVEVRFADRVIQLDERDSLQFPGHLQHQVRRVSEVACVLITVSRA